jgi:1,4-dihydroxy-2-naphthoate octaprenyltransferase
MTRPPLARVLLEAARPRTLPAGLAPVLFGTAFAVADGRFDGPAFVLTVLAALAIQVGTNYANDYYDARKGADTEARVGPRRATQAGLVSPATMRRAFIATFAVAVLLGTGLIVRGGLPILLIGVASVACGVLYTGGPRPLGYLGLGDLFVLVFFGPVAVAGTHYVQTLSFSRDVALAGLGPGLLSVAILIVNNLRDRHTDVGAGKRTLAVRFGARFARIQYAAAVLLGLGITVGMAATRTPFAWAGLVLTPLAVRLIRKVWTIDGAALNPLLGETARLLLLTTLASSAALLAVR